MSDRYAVFSNFKWGLDGRKSELSLQPGALLQLVNGHINAGGECEQRKTFAKDGTPFPPYTFGLQDTDSGLQTYGDKAPGINGQTSPLPTGVAYVQLVAPDNNPNGNIMSSIVFSCNYLGKAFVIAKYAMGTFAFYNGVLVNPTRDGLVLQENANPPAESLSQLSVELAAIVNRLSNWIAKANTTATPITDSPPISTSNLHESALNGATIVEAPPSDTFTPVLSLKSASGTIGAKHIDQAFPGISVVGACVAFTLNSGASGSIDVQAPRNSDGTNVVTLTNGPVNFNTSLAQTAADVSSAINKNSYLTGYTAYVTSATVTVCAPATWGNVTFNLTTVEVTLTTIAGVVAPSYTLSLVSTPTGFQNISFGTFVGKTLGVNVKASVNISTNANTFAWSETNADGTPVTTPSGISMSSTVAASVTFSKHLVINTSVTGFFKCVATNSGNPTSSPATQYFTIYLEYDSST